MTFHLKSSPECQITMQPHVKALESGDKEISQLPGEIENDRLKAAH